MAQWNAEQYLKFKRERTQPSYDLAGRIDVKNPQSIIDIGCGPGNSTSVLAGKFKGAYILGVDKSENMINTAKKDYPSIDFAVFDAEKDFDKINRGFDVVFSNACIQWVPNHPALIRNMFNLLNPGGVLAVQVPINYREPIHQIINEISHNSKWSAKFKVQREFYTLTSSEYFDLLSEITDDFSMWETVYYHRMKSHKDIMEWYKGTGLRPYLEVLSADEAADFENDIYSEVIKSYPLQKRGEIIFRFPRLFFTAVKHS